MYDATSRRARQRNMLSIVLALAVIGGPSQEPIDFQLGWKQGDKFTYTFGIKGQGFTSEAKANFTVTKTDEKALTVSWPFTSVAQGEDIAAGSLQLTRHGRVLNQRNNIDGELQFFLWMLLPEKPVSVGDEFKVTLFYVGSQYDWSGKLEKIDETKGRLAHFSIEGKFNFGGQLTDIKLSSVFDMDRGLFASGEILFEKYKVTSSFKLVNKGSGDKV